jgi:hypothetical protein
LIGAKNRIAGLTLRATDVYRPHGWGTGGWRAMTKTLRRE